MTYSTYWSSLYKRRQNIKKAKVPLSFDKQLNVYSWSSYAKTLNKSHVNPKSSPK